MKFSLSSLVFLSLTGSSHVAAQFVEPPWWPLIQTTFSSVERLRQCESQLGVPYTTGTSCMKSKTCFFGEQTCDGSPYPDTKCTCYPDAWQCDPVPCPGPLPAAQCSSGSSSVVIDFETAADDSALAPGTYVENEWSLYGITVSASGGFGTQPRLFDTSNPGTVDDGDPDLGSPNELCSPSGPGEGTGGVPGSVGENCVPQGNVLIVQESDKATPDDNAVGGMIVFDFASPTDVNSLGLMDIESGGTPTTVVVTRSDGTAELFNSLVLGDNSVENIAINVAGATQVKITFGTSGAVTYLDICAGCPTPPGMGPDPNPDVGNGQCGTVASNGACQTGVCGGEFQVQFAGTCSELALVLEGLDCSMAGSLAGSYPLKSSPKCPITNQDLSNTIHGITPCSQCFREETPAGFSTIMVQVDANGDLDPNYGAFTFKCGTNCFSWGPTALLGCN